MPARDAPQNQNWTDRRKWHAAEIASATLVLIAICGLVLIETTGMGSG